MTDSDWQTCQDPGELLWEAVWVRPRASERKLRLFACACARQTWHNLVDPRSRAAVEAAELYADGGLPPADLTAACAAAEEVAYPDDPPTPKNRERVAEYVEVAAAGVAASAARAHDGWAFHYHAQDALDRALDSARHQCFGPPYTEARAGLAALARDVFGPPRPPTSASAWQSADVVGLARTMYGSRDFTRMPVLADALAVAGCADADILGHCRGPGPHVRGCWVVDIVLGKG